MTWVSDKAIQRLREAVEAPDLSGTRYRLLGRLAHGGMGVVWLAHDGALDRRVALKVLDISDEQEARVLAKLEHPGIVPVHDAGRLADGRVFYTMKFVEGNRLDQHVRRTTSVPDLLRIAHGICETVAFAHAHGVLHCDLKPENIMVGPFGEVLVMDWGLAVMLRDGAAENTGVGEPAGCEEADAKRKPDRAQPQLMPCTARNWAREARARQGEHQEEGPTLTRVGGTAGYMAPEQASGEKADIDERSDVYSLGVILQFIFADRHPDKRLRAIIGKAKAEEPEMRYPGAAALASDITAYFDGLPIEAYSESAAERAVRFLNKHRLAVGLVIAYAIVRLLIHIFLGT